ncbi:hypothetical protein FLL45_08160 [Aliikangiella marina]|uniref:Uncharacterized protein n=1 Tax=Aliikangiella marina TaxID=1712262 RepID=A0A545TCH2_9GAMM|nr:hypothetical protein [Aliikangiella marina]TQV74923.1 hypothetical protein FLL45_08160 [Aliikangiella marina]
MRKILFIAVISLSFLSNSALAEGWCYYNPGDYELVTSGNKTNKVYVLGKFNGSSVNKRGRLG